MDGCPTSRSNGPGLTLLAPAAEQCVRRIKAAPPMNGFSGRRRVARRVSDTRAAISSAVLVLLSALVLAGPLVSRAQPTGKVSRIGVIVEGPDPWFAAFRHGLRELGYGEGENIFIEPRYLHGALDRVPGFASELIRLRVDVLVVGGTMAARSARAHTTTVPIVFTLVSDPVGSGLVTSLARPGGNATGVSNVVSNLSGKQLQLLKTAAPKVARVAVLHNPENPAARAAVDEAREAARALGMELQVLAVRQRREMTTVLPPPPARGVEGILAISDPAIGHSELVQLAARRRLPAITAPKEFAKGGGLLAYGPSYSHNWLRAATYVAKILKGARPADLPVEQPTVFELVINLRAAQALGLKIPQSLLLQADEVIQ